MLQTPSCPTTENYTVAPHRRCTGYHRHKLHSRPVHRAYMGRFPGGQIYLPRSSNRRLTLNRSLLDRRQRTHFTRPGQSIATYLRRSKWAGLSLTYENISPCHHQVLKRPIPTILQILAPFFHNKIPLIVALYHTRKVIGASRTYPSQG